MSSVIPLKVVAKLFCMPSSLMLCLLFGVDDFEILPLVTAEEC
jgi:hypothetical protein